jgi:hypothetical protein
MPWHALRVIDPKRLATLVLIGLVGATLAGCKWDSTRTATTGGNSGGTVVPPPSGTSNRAPIIAGTPVTTAKISIPYSFQPTARDADGTKLIFSIQGKPDWAAFDTSTGRLEGTPPAGSNGTYSGIQISVSDGTTTAALSPFSISVVDPVIGSAELSWQPPTLNEDGTVLEDLSGYVIRYGKTIGALDQSVRITNPGTTMYVLENLVEGTWYFALSSVNSMGVEGRPTGYVSKSIG